MNDHFSLFGLPQRFALDPAALEGAYKFVQAKVHPDRFVAASPAERRVAMQWATRANEAFAVLRSPLQRAAYLCELRGFPIDAESNTTMPREFMMRQMELREALEEAKHPVNLEKIAGLSASLARQRDDIEAQVRAMLDEQSNLPHAAALIREWMFVERFGEEVERAQHAAQDAAAV